MDNVLFGPDPHPDAFSTTYSYDAAGNIRQLMRRGLIGTGQTLQSDTIDLLDYTYAGSDSSSSILVNVKDRASNPLAQPLGVTASENGYSHDGNGNLTLAGPVLQAQYNIMNLPTSIRTEAGKRHFAYVYGGGKYEARIEADTALSETRHYLGGIEFVDGNPESYNFGDGRIVYSDTVPPRPQFRLTDHLGNTVVFFEDKDNNGCITTEADTSGLAVEVLQRLWYYPFGMQMENLSTWETEPGQAYRYNGKERDTLSGWTDFGARWGILEIGRWNGVDPLADQMPGWSPYSYGFDNPIQFIDPDGMAPASPDNEYRISIRNGQATTEYVSDRGGDQTDYVTVINYDKAPRADAIYSYETPVNIEYTSGPGRNPIKDPTPGSREYHGKEHTDVLAYTMLLGGKGTGALLKQAAKGGIANSRALGIAGEQAVGLSGAKTAIQVGGRTRIPDALTRTTLTEVKNVKSLSFTRQLRDFHTYSQQNRLDFILYTRPNTTLSGPLKQAINNGSIIHRFIPGS